MTSDERRADGVPIWRRDFPYEAAAEEEVTRREFARYLVLGAGAMAAGNVGLAVVDAAADRSTPASRAAIVALDERRRRRHLPVPLPRRRRPGRSCLRVADREVVAFSQKCTHLGCVVYYEADEDRWHCPCHEGNFDALHRRRDLRPADRARSGASTSRSATTA